MLIKLERKKKIRIYGSESVAKLVRTILAKEHGFMRDQEQLFAIGLTHSNHVKYIDMVSLGSLGSMVVEPREVFRMAVHRAAGSLIISHNHPGNNKMPSNTDINTTRQLVAAGRILRIEVIDHVIVCDEDHYSFADEGTLNG
ncbi:MAG: JAB domain-containing protein [Bacteroidia bacterium]